MGGTLPATIAHDHRIAEVEALRRLCSLYPAETSAAPVTKRALALAPLKVGDPAEPHTDIGPIIDAPAPKPAGQITFSELRRKER